MSTGKLNRIKVSFKASWIKMVKVLAFFLFVLGKGMAYLFYLCTPVYFKYTVRSGQTSNSIEDIEA